VRACNSSTRSSIVFNGTSTASIRVVNVLMDAVKIAICLEFS
jgi:hypothetical protein